MILFPAIVRDIVALKETETMRDKRKTVKIREHTSECIRRNYIFYIIFL